MSKLNIILIITDQQRYDTIAALGFPYVDTPNLDMLARQGVSFDNTFVTAPSCVPSRASLFTGHFPHITGIYRNGDLWRHSWVELLAQAGYYTVNIGKMHTSPQDTPMGFRERHVVENKDRPYSNKPPVLDEWDAALEARGLERPGRRTYRYLHDYKERLGAFKWTLPEDLHSDIFVGNLALDWIRGHSPEAPIFLQIGFPGPHPPYDPIPRYADSYLGKDIPQPVVTEKELAAEPRPLTKLRQEHIKVDHDAVVHQLKPSPEQQHRQRAYYLANITMIDEKIGEILSALSEQGYLNSAVVIFTSDHGDALGDHGHSQKWTMYDCSTRVPAIIWSPGRIEAGKRISDQIQWMDLGPTILEFAQVEVPGSIEAGSLLPLLAGETPGREYVFAEQARDGLLRETELMTMVRHRSWKLVHFVDHPTGQLFDLDNDPDELNNLWNESGYENTKHELTDVLLTWRLRSGLITRDWNVQGR